MHIYIYCIYNNNTNNNNNYYIYIVFFLKQYFRTIFSWHATSWSLSMWVSPFPVLSAAGTPPGDAGVQGCGSLVDPHVRSGIIFFWMGSSEKLQETHETLISDGENHGFRLEIFPWNHRDDMINKSSRHPWIWGNRWSIETRKPPLSRA